MRSRSRRLRAYVYYLGPPTRRFLPLLGGLVVVLLVGAACFRTLYAPEHLSYLRALHVTFSLVFANPSLDFPDHWILQLFYFLLPPLGLTVILDGIVRFSYHVLRRDEAGKEWCRAMTRTMTNHVVLCGLGRLGLRTLQQLIALGEQVVVLEKDPQCPALAYAYKNGVPVRIGHSREEGIFDELNIRQAKSIILATNDDLANLEMAIDARKLNPGIRAVLRMFDQELAAKLRETFALQLTFSTSELAAPLFATSSTDASIVNSFYVGEELLVVARIRVNAGSELAGKAIRELGSTLHAFVLSHGRDGGADLFPSAQAVLGAGDVITVQATPECLRRIHGLNHDPEPY